MEKPFEVWCHSCNVTFPPEQKNCLHCGERLHPERPGRSLHARDAEFVLRTGGFQPVQPDEQASGRTTLPSTQAEAEAEEEEPVRRSLIRAGMTVVWMVLLAAGYAWRACSQQ